MKELPRNVCPRSTQKTTDGYVKCVLCLDRAVGLCPECGVLLCNHHLMIGHCDMMLRILRTNNVMQFRSRIEYEFKGPLTRLETAETPFSWCRGCDALGGRSTGAKKEAARAGAAIGAAAMLGMPLLAPVVWAGRTCD